MLCGKGTQRDEQHHIFIYHVYAFSLRGIIIKFAHTKYDSRALCYAAPLHGVSLEQN